MKPNAAVSQLVANALVTLVRECCTTFFGILYHNAQTGIRSIFYIVLE